MKKKNGEYALKIRKKEIEKKGEYTLKKKTRLMREKNGEYGFRKKND